MDGRSRPFKRISLEERKQLEQYCKDKRAITWIVMKMKRSRTTLEREIRKNGGMENYSAEKAHRHSLISSSFRSSNAKLLGVSLQDYAEKFYYESNGTINIFKLTNSLIERINIIEQKIEKILQKIGEVS